MNHELLKCAQALSLEAQEQANLALEFGVACVQRVRHLIVDPQALEALDDAARFIAGRADERAMRNAAQRAAEVAQSHPGSGVIDGAGSAAVSATTGLARALNGKPLDAAGYCAYAAVYAYSSSSVTDPRAYLDEHAWQAQTLQALAARRLETRAPG